VNVWACTLGRNQQPMAGVEPQATALSTQLHPVRLPIETQLPRWYVPHVLLLGSAFEDGDPLPHACAALTSGTQPEQTSVTTPLRITRWHPSEQVPLYIGHLGVPRPEA
jgi:hypothetical protein